MWRGGKCIRPYFLDVKLIVDNQHTIDLFRQPYLSDSAPNPIGGGSPGGVVTGSSLSRSTAVPVPVQRNSRPNLPNNGHNCFKRVVRPERLGFIHFPIEDCNVTDDTGVLLLARQLVYDISRGDVLYLHCWGGHGRTGTVVCLMLHLMYGISAVEAMRRCQAAHDLRQYPVKVGSPQTETQRSQVARIIAVLEEQQRAEAARAQAHAEAMQQLDAQVQKAVAPPDVLEDTDEMTVAGLDRSSPDVMRMEVDAHLQAQLQPTGTVTGTAGSGMDTGTAIPIPTSGNPSNLSGRVRARAAGDAGNALANQQPPAATAGAKSEQTRPAAAVAVVATPSKIPVRTGANSAGLGGLGAGYAPAAPSSTTPSSNATLGGGGGGGGVAGSSSAGSEADSLQKGGLHRFRQQWRTPTGGNSVDTSVDGAATSPLPSSVACTVPSTPTPAAAAAAATPAAGSGTGGLSKIFNNYIGLNDPSPNPNANPNAAVQQGVEAALADASATGTSTGTGTGTVALVGASAAPVRQVRRGDSGLAFTGSGSHHRVPAIATQAAAPAGGAGIAIPSPIETAPPTILSDGSSSAVSSPVIAQKTKVARTTPTPTKEGQTTSFAEKDGFGLGLTAGPCL
jgi:hypothetical protein